MEMHYRAPLIFAQSKTIATHCLNRPPHHIIKYLEELLPKDNENMPLPDVSELTATEPQAFAPEEMVRCQECSRANPPTRVSCLYCGATFAFDERTAVKQRPTLAPLEKWQAGYNNILVPSSHTPAPSDPEQLAALLKLSVGQLEIILRANMPLPLARTSTLDEAMLVERRLKDFQLVTRIVSDKDLRIEESPTLRIRAAEFQEQGMLAHQTASESTIFVPWSAFVLLVRGRFLFRSVEVRERKSGRVENQIVESTETTADEAVVDIFSGDQIANLRIAAHSFDFSCLADQKGLLAEENFSRLIELLRVRAPQLTVDDSYRSVKQALEFVWPSESQTASRGWRRERPGKFTLGALTEISNETQFTRYSRLIYQMNIHANHGEAKQSG